MPALVDTTIVCSDRIRSRSASRPPSLLASPRCSTTAGFALPRGVGRRRLRHRGPARDREPVGADPRARARDSRRRWRWRCAAASSSGSHPVDADFIRRFIAYGRAERDRGLPAQRPAQRRLEPARSGRGDRRRRARVRGRPRLQLRPDGRDGPARRAGVEAARARRRARGPPRPDGIAAAAPRERARHAAARGDGLPVGVYCQGSGGNALAVALEAARAGADLIATAVYPVALTLHRVSGREPRRGARRSRPRPRGRRAEAVGGVGPDRRAHRRRAGDAARAADRRARGGARPARGSRRRARRQPPRAVRAATGSTRC